MLSRLDYHGYLPTCLSENVVLNVEFTVVVAAFSIIVYKL